MGVLNKHTNHCLSTPIFSYYYGTTILNGAHAQPGSHER
jgi:hypothetical protein